MCRGGRGEAAATRRHFTAVGGVLLPLGQRAAALPVELVVEQRQGGEVLGGDGGAAQAQQREDEHRGDPATGGHVAHV